MNKTIRQFLFLTLAMFAVSCSTDFRPIYDDNLSPEDDKVDVKVDIDGSNVDMSGVDPELADEYTLIMYPTDGSKPTIFTIDSDTPTISIDEGDYSAIIFNGRFDNHPGLSFDDIDDYEKLKVYFSGEDMGSSYYALYSDSSELVTISDDSETLEFTLSDIFTTMHITTYVKSINLLSDKGSYAIVDGLASGVTLYNQKSTKDDPMRVNMPFTIYAYNVGSTLNGYLRGQFRSFGIYKSVEGERDNNATLYLKLDGNGYQEFKRDITNDIDIVDNDDHVLSVEIPNIVITK